MKVLHFPPSSPGNQNRFTDEKDKDDSRLLCETRRPLQGAERCGVLSESVPCVAYTERCHQRSLLRPTSKRVPRGHLRIDGAKTICHDLPCSYTVSQVKHPP